MCGIFLRPEAAQACDRKAIDDTGHEWYLGADDRQTNVFSGRKFQQCIDIFGCDSNIAAALFTVSLYS